MSSAGETPPKTTGGADSQEPANDSRSEPLFTKLFASRPPHERRSIWVIAALLHLPLVLFFWFTDTGQSFRDALEEVIRPILLVDDNPPAIVHPQPPKVAEAPQPKPAPKPDERRSPSTPVPPTLQTGEAVTNTPATQTPVAGGSIGGTLPSSGSLRERLSPPISADGLLAPLPPIPGLSGMDASRERLAQRIRFYNDSIMAERVAAANATDWTIKGEDGKRWGVSPGKLHLGDITLPLPLAFVTPPGRRDEANARMRTYVAIEQQAVRAQLKDSFEDRVKEIRKRKDAERAEAKKKPVTNDRLP